MTAHMVTRCFKKRLAIQASFKEKVFVWRVMIFVLLVGETLRSKNIDNGSCIWCMVVLENNYHRFLSCPVAKKVWELVDAVWMSVSGVSKRPFHWVFSQMDCRSSPRSLQIIWDFLRYWGLWHIWRMRNTFIFEQQSGVRWYLGRLKGQLLWQFYLLENSGLLTDEEVQMCRSTTFHVRHLLWPT